MVTGLRSNSDLGRLPHLGKAGSTNTFAGDSAISCLKMGALSVAGRGGVLGAGPGAGGAAADSGNPPSGK